MGRDKTPKPAAAVAEVKAEIIIGLDGKPQRPPRGNFHFQSIEEMVAIKDSSMHLSDHRILVHRISSTVSYSML